LSSLLNLLPKN